MDDPWFTEIPDELARCLTDARNCADACEALLTEVASAPDDEPRQRVVDAVIGPAAVSRVLTELVDQPRPLALAAARLCHETAQEAVGKLERLDGRLELRPAITALRACAESCENVLRAEQRTRATGECGGAPS
ncbi:MAG: hypothetical protein ABI990_10345 [Actinomycetota bacterium]